MAFKKQNFKINGVTDDDIAALSRANEILARFQNTCVKGDLLMSLADGEIVKIEELARVRGILSFFANNDVFEVNP